MVLVISVCVMNEFLHDSDTLSAPNVTHVCRREGERERGREGGREGRKEGEGEGEGG